ncbi:hypothetical protein [Synechocystis sp. PCC 7509]|uniref:hypothetical protein n=1 Tax=Synechocystis sp. PCC 7509 TaxID=927677 RepID=UPI0002ABEBE4|nr:hypothetical protein [Synechocystis sp. PCC 7509]
MNLSPALQQEIEQIAMLQGISPEQFILQTLTEKINAFKQELPNLSITESLSNSADSHLREKEGILVFDTQSLERIDFNQLIEQSRERDWEQLGL